MPPGRLRCYKSIDGGENWTQTYSFPGVGYDHPMAAVDNTGGPNDGSIYVTALYSRDYQLVLMTSTDQGKSFSERNVFLESGPDRPGIFNANILVLSDGTLFVPYIQSHDKDITDTDSFIMCQRSADGGTSFTESVQIAKRRYIRDEAFYLGMPVFAVDRSDKFKDRIYVSYVSHHSDTLRLFFSYSDDRGATWKDPKLVDDTGVVDSIQFQPTLAVNNRGEVGAGWYDSRGTESEFGYYQYFSISVDGGKSFLPPKRVSTQESNPLGIGNLRMESMSFDRNGSKMIIPSSVFARYYHGGEYMGLMTRDDGSFIPVWADSRSGTFQMYMRSIGVLRSSDSRDSASPRAALVKTNVSDKVKLIVDQTITRLEEQQVEFHIRLKNISEDPVYGPLKLELTQWSFPQLETKEEAYPVILNASNNETGVGAEFDYSSSIGPDMVLEPGELSGSVVWKFEVKSYKQVWPPLVIEIEGQVEKE